MKKFVIIGANSFQNPLILKAKSLGYETHVFAWKDGSIGEETADFFYPISIIEKEKILEICKEINPCGIATIASDLATITVNYVANKLNLPCNSEECTLLSTNKYEMRKALKNADIPTPNFAITNGKDTSSISNISYPLIVKPTDRSGSRAITKLLNRNGLAQAIDNAIKNSFENKAIVEEYIEGDEYSCECISYKGNHKFLSITKKYTTGYPHYIEAAHMEPYIPSEELKDKILTNIFGALDALKIENGASHSEFKITPSGDIRIIEIGARMGGDCIGSHLVNISTGMDFLKMVIDVATGVAPSFEVTFKPKVAVIKFIFSEADMLLLNTIKKNNKIQIIYESTINKINSHKIIDSSSRFGYYILSFDSNDNAQEFLTYANK